MCLKRIGRSVLSYMKVRHMRSKNRKAIPGGLRFSASPFLLGFLALMMCVVPARLAEADSVPVSVKPFIAFGADLTSKEKAEVLKQLGITEEELADYETTEVTNKEEHEYLDEYLASRVIGTRALSSVMIEEADAGSGIQVETHNISFCSKEMYTNALVTAGISDARVTVAGPFQISGTAALVGAMKAYGIMTGEEIGEEKSDAATNELVLTSELGDSIGKEEAAQFVALLKDKVVSDKLSSEEEIRDAIEEAEKELNLNISDDMKKKMVGLMQKIGGLDLDLDKLKDQAQGVYDKLKDMGIDLDSAEGLWEKICNFFIMIWNAIVNFFKGLFG